MPTATAKKTAAKRTAQAAPKPANRMHSPTTGSEAMTDRDFDLLTQHIDSVRKKDSPTKKDFDNLQEHFDKLRLHASAEETVSLQASGTGATTAGNKIRGYEGQVYYTVTGGTETLFANIVDFDLDIKADSIDATDRASVGWKDKLGGLKEWTGTLKANSIQNGVDLTAFYNALIGGATLAGSFRPQDISAGLAFTGNFVITSFKYSSPGTGLQTLDLNIEGRGALVLGAVATGGQ